MCALSVCAGNKVSWAQDDTCTLGNHRGNGGFLFISGFPLWMLVSAACARDMRIPRHHQMQSNLNLRTITWQKCEAVTIRLEIKAPRLIYHSTLGSRVIKKKKKILRIEPGIRSALVHAWRAAGLFVASHPHLAYLTRRWCQPITPDFKLLIPNPKHHLRIKS